MTINRVAQLADYFALKYKIADISKETILESSLKKDIVTLHNYLTKNFPILAVCATTNPGNPKTPDDLKALLGYKFCRELFNKIEWLHDRVEVVDLAQIRESVVEILKLIEENKDLKIDSKGKVTEDENAPAPSVQFPHVSELIFQTVSAKTKAERVIRDKQFQSFKAGLARILGLSSQMLEKISKLETISPDRFHHKHVEDKEEFIAPERFTPQRANLSSYDIIDFIRQHGDMYGLDTQEEWGLAIDTDPQLRNDLTTVINALNRGHYPRGAYDVKSQIAGIMQRHRERISNNVSALENEDL